MKNEKDNISKPTPFYQTEPLTKPIKSNSERRADGFLRVIMLLISLISLAIAMVSVAYVAVHFLIFHTPRLREHIWSVVVAIGLAYAVGWLVALFGIRLYHNLVLPIAIRIYAWTTLGGISILYIAILYRLYEQKYYATSFAKYTVLMWITIAGLIGMHLLIEGHSLRLFSLPILLIALVHLFLIVYHYVYALDVNYDYLAGDVLFFLGMTTVSVLMLMHVGILSGLRNFIDRLFEKSSQKNGNAEMQSVNPEI